MNSTYLTAFQKAFKIGSVIGILVLAYFFHTNADMCRVSHRELMSVWRHDCIRADRLSQCRSALVKPLTSFHRGAQSDQNVTFASVCVEGADSWSDTCIVNLDFKVLVVVHRVLFSALLLSVPSRWLMGNWPPSSPRWSSSPAPMFSAAVCVERKASSVSSAKTDRSSTPSRRAQPRGTDHQITVLNIYLTKEIWAGHVILIYKKENRQKTGTLHWWLPDKHYKAEQALQYVDKKTHLSPFGARLDSVPYGVSLFMISCCWYMNITLSGRGFHLPLKVQIEQTSIMLEYDRWIYQHTNCECLHDSLVFYLSRTHWGDFWHFEPELTICLKLSCLDWICLSMCLSVAFASFLLCFSSNSRGPVQRLLERLFRKQWAVSTTLHFFFWDCS